MAVVRYLIPKQTGIEADSYSYSPFFYAFNSLFATYLWIYLQKNLEAYL